MKPQRVSSAIALIMQFAAASALCIGSAAVGVCGTIHDAAQKGDQARVIALLKQNPDLVSSRDKFGNTPLHLAALHDHPTVAALLLANGADVNAQGFVRADYDGISRSGETPLTLALLSYEHKEMMDLLLTHGADVNVALAGGVTPLHRAVDRDLPYDVELLLANGADPNRKGFDWETPVHLAVRHGRISILELLLRAGADPNVKNRAGYTPLDYATHLYSDMQFSSNKKIEALLRAYGAHE